MPLLPPVKPRQYNDDNEDYRPPVPPHRNIGVSTQNVMLDESPRRHHHHRHYHGGKDNKKRESKPDYHKNDNNEAIDNISTSQPLKNIFEFDDEPSTPSNTPINDVRIRAKVDKEQPDEEEVEFVEFSTTQNNEGNCNNFDF